ncbi:MAG TPA: hypothetical protein VIG66_10395 [Noviherbaspirillum sp.]
MKINELLNPASLSINDLLNPASPPPVPANGTSSLRPSIPPPLSSTERRGARDASDRSAQLRHPNLRSRALPQNDPVAAAAAGRTPDQVARSEAAGKPAQKSSRYLISTLESKVSSFKDPKFQEVLRKRLIKIKTISETDDSGIQRIEKGTAIRAFNRACTAVSCVEERSAKEGKDASQWLETLLDKTKVDLQGKNGNPSDEKIREDQNDAIQSECKLSTQNLRILKPLILDAMGIDLRLKPKPPKKRKAPSAEESHAHRGFRPSLPKPPSS